MLSLFLLATFGYLAYCLYRLVVLPKNLRQFETVPIHAMFWMIFKDGEYLRYWKKYLRPAFAKDKIISVYNLLFWSLNVGDYEVAKQISINIEQFPKVLNSDFLDKSMQTLGGKFFGQNIVLSNGDTWRRFHKVLAKPFIKVWPTEVFGVLAKKFFDVIEQEKSLDITPWFKRLTFDVLSETILDLDINSMENANAPLYWHIQHIVREMLKPVWLLLVHIDREWNPLRKDDFEKLKEYHQIVRNTLNDKKKQFTDEELSTRKDLISLLLAANAEEGDGKLSEKELIDNLSIFFIAGHDTTATALTSIMYLLATHSEIQEKAREEVQSVLTHNDEIPSHEQLKKMPYVLAIIKESQRLYPSVTQIPFRRAISDYELPDGRVISEGTIISLNVVEINRDPKAWPDPDNFKPERFLRDTASTAQSANYLTFGYGKRICLGMQFSILEQRVILSMMLNRFKWKMTDPKQILEFGASTLTVPKSLGLTFEEVQ